MSELRHMDVRHLIEESHHLANGCTAKCGCTGLMLFRYLSRLSAIICDIRTSDVAQSHTSSGFTGHTVRADARINKRTTKLILSYITYSILNIRTVNKVLLKNHQ